MITEKQAELMRSINRCTGRYPSNKLIKFLTSAKITTAIRTFKLTEEKAKTIPGFDKSIMKELKLLNELSINSTPKVNSGNPEFSSKTKKERPRPSGIDLSEM